MVTAPFFSVVHVIVILISIEYGKSRMSEAVRPNIAALKYTTWTVSIRGEY